MICLLYFACVWVCWVFMDSGVWCFLVDLLACFGQLAFGVCMFLCGFCVLFGC